MPSLGHLNSGSYVYIDGYLGTWCLCCCQTFSVTSPTGPHCSQLFRAPSLRVGPPQSPNWGGEGAIRHSRWHLILKSGVLWGCARSCPEPVSQGGRSRGRRVSKCGESGHVLSQQGNAKDQRSTWELCDGANCWTRHQCTRQLWLWLTNRFVLSGLFYCTLMTPGSVPRSFRF